MRHHRNHESCSIYAPCRRADLDAAWQDFKARVDDPATRQAALAEDSFRRATGRPVEWKPATNPFVHPEPTSRWEWPLLWLLLLGILGLIIWAAATQA